MTSDQEAVCGNANSGIGVCGSDSYAAIDVLAGGTVVPSDERCGFKYKSGFMCNRVPATHKGMKHEWVKGEPDWKLRGPLNVATSTPSQDAEGDGQHCVRCGGLPLWYIHDESNPLGHVCLNESAIRAPYEELVEAEITRKTAERHMDSRDMMQRIIARRDLVEAEDRIDAVLTRIEESHQ